MSVQNCGSVNQTGINEYMVQIQGLGNPMIFPSNSVQDLTTIKFDVGYLYNVSAFFTTTEPNFTSIQITFSDGSGNFIYRYFPTIPATNNGNVSNNFLNFYFKATNNAVLKMTSVTTGNTNGSISFANLKCSRLGEFRDFAF